jgi:hypothetical protein
MTPLGTLVELLNRLGAQQGAAVHIGNDELCGWPAEAVAAMKSARLLVKARHASSMVCPGCERECAKTVKVFPAESGRPARAFIICNEPEDLGRISVELHELERWQLTGEVLAGALNRLLGFAKPPQRDRTGKRWTLGLLKGNEHKGEAKLTVDDGVTLLVAGHSVLVEDIIRFDGGGLTADKAELLRLVDKPATPPGVPNYKPSTTRREMRKLGTRNLRAEWKKKYRELRKKNPDKSDVWISQQIAKTEAGRGKSSETIRKNMRK